MAGLLDPFPASEPTGCGWWRLHQFQHCHGSGKDVTAPWEAQARYVAAHAVPARPRYGSHLPHCGSPHQCMATSQCHIECNTPKESPKMGRGIAAIVGSRRIVESRGVTSARESRQGRQRGLQGPTVSDTIIEALYSSWMRLGEFRELSHGAIPGPSRSRSAGATFTRLQKSRGGGLQGKRDLPQRHATVFSCRRSYLDPLTTGIHRCLPHCQANLGFSVDTIHISPDFSAYTPLP